MAVTVKIMKVGEAKVIDTSPVYSRVVGLQASSREVGIKDILAYQLSTIPT